MLTPPLLDKSQGIALITDGSANYRDRSGGWAFVAIDAFDGIYTRASNRSNTTISQMELVAVTKGLEWLKSHCGPCEVLVYSDSEYVVLGANNPRRKRARNKKYWNELDEAIWSHDYVEFNHVRGHSDHFWNEMADQLAREARLKGLTA